jgi:hypothetical protein
MLSRGIKVQKSWARPDLLSLQRHIQPGNSKTNSTEWQGANQTSFRVGDLLQVNASQTNLVSIPITAENWRVTSTYRRWRYPVKLINFVFRDLIGTGEIFDDHKDYDFTSTVWKLPSPPTNQLTSEP